MPTIDEMPSRRRLARTLRDADALQAIPTPDRQSVAIAREIILRATRDFGPSPAAVLRHLTAEEARLASLGLTDEEREIIAAFDASVGIGFGPAVRR